MLVLWLLLFAYVSRLSFKCIIHVLLLIPHTVYCCFYIRFLLLFFFHVHWAPQIRYVVYILCVRMCVFYFRFSRQSSNLIAFASLVKKTNKISVAAQCYFSFFHSFILDAVQMESFIFNWRTSHNLFGCHLIFNCETIFIFVLYFNKILCISIKYHSIR